MTLRPYPLTALPGALTQALAAAGVGTDPISLDALLASGGDQVAVTSAEELPTRMPAGWKAVALRFGERRTVVTGLDGEVARQRPGTRISVPDRPAALLLGLLYRELSPVVEDPPVAPGTDGGPSTPSLAPLWMDPGLATRGEVLSPGEWLPSAGQGIPVLVHHRDHPVPGVEGLAGAQAVLDAERCLVVELGGRAVRVQGRSFGPGIRLRAVVVSPDGRHLVRGSVQGPVHDWRGVTGRLMELLHRRGVAHVAPLSSSL